MPLVSLKSSLSGKIKVEGLVEAILMFTASPQLYNKRPTLKQRAILTRTIAKTILWYTAAPPL